MVNTLRDTRPQDYDWLGQRFDTSLRLIARRSVRVWFNRGRLDQVLSENVGVCPHCELLYAIDSDGRQVSSNIRTGAIDADAYGQDLSRRPYSVSLSVLNNAAFLGAFLCDTYISQASRRPCVTVMYGVTAGQSVLGYIAADFDPASLNRSLQKIQAVQTG